jgi:hypothetical protein
MAELGLSSTVSTMTGLISNCSRTTHIKLASGKLVSARDGSLAQVKRRPILQHHGGLWDPHIKGEIDIAYLRYLSEKQTVVLALIKHEPSFQIGI